MKKSKKEFECPKCGSKHIFIKESMFTTLYHCLKCGNEWKP